jgi:hypothetical protein
MEKTNEKKRQKQKEEKKVFGWSLCAVRATITPVHSLSQSAVSMWRFIVRR